MHALTILHRCVEPLLGGIHARFRKKVTDLFRRRSDPIVKIQVGDSVEFLCIVRHQRAAEMKCMGGDQHVVRSDVRPP